MFASDSSFFASAGRLGIGQQYVGILACFGTVHLVTNFLTLFLGKKLAFFALEFRLLRVGLALLDGFGAIALQCVLVGLLGGGQLGEFMV